MTQRTSWIVLTALITTGVVIMILGLIGANMDSPNELGAYVQPTPTVISPQVKKDVAVPPGNLLSKDEMRSAFNSGCVDDGKGTYAYCNCVFDNIMDKHGERKFTEIILEYNKPGGLSDANSKIFVDAVMACLDKM